MVVLYININLRKHKPLHKIIFIFINVILEAEIFQFPNVYFFGFVILSNFEKTNLKITRRISFLNRYEFTPKWGSISNDNLLTVV